MATRTIANGGGNWSSTATWVEGVVPTATDDVVVTGTSGNLIIDVAASCRSIDLTGYVGTVTHNSGIALAVGTSTDPPANNALVFPSSGWTYTLGSATTSAISFASTSSTALNVNTGGKTLGNTLFGQAVGSPSWKLTADLTIGSSATLTLTRGTFDANGFNVTCGLFLSSNTNTRSLTMGTGTWTLTGNAGTIWSMNNVSGLTFIRGGAVVCNYSGATGTRTLIGGGSEATAVDFTITAGTDIVTLGTGANGRCRDLKFDGFTGTWSNALVATVNGSLMVTAASSGMTVGSGTGALSFGATSGTKTITTAGKTLDFPVTVSGAGGTYQLADNLTIGVTRTLTLIAGTLDFNGKNVSTGKLASSGSGVRTLTMGSGTLTLTGTGTVWNTATVTNLTLTPGTCAVSLTGTAATIAGSPTFYSLTKTVTTADILTFNDGIIVTVTNALVLQGASGQLLTLVGSGTSGWTLAVPATQSINHVSVSYSTATGNSALAASSDSIDGGNNVNWVFISVNSISPVISGTVSVGSTLTTTNGTWTNSPTSYTYQWQRADNLAFTQNITNIGSNQNTFTLTNSENSKYIRCQVTAINLAGSSTNSSNILGPIITNTSKGQAYKSPINNYYPNPIKL